MHCMLVLVLVIVIVLVLVMHLVLANLLQAGTGSHLSAGRGQLRARLTSQLGVTARWPHPSTAPSLPLSPKLGPEPIIRTEKTLLHPSSSAQSNFTTQIILFSLRKLFHNSFWPRPPPCLQHAQFQLKYDSPVVLVVSFQLAQTLRLIHNFAEPSVFP